MTSPTSPPPHKCAWPGCPQLGPWTCQTGHKCPLHAGRTAQDLNTGNAAATATGTHHSRSTP
ncbi:MAG: hypothetical protein WCP28_07200 [Actinomycetes bacterium]